MRLIDRLFRGRKPSVIPDDDLTLVKTSRGEAAAIAVINGAMAAAGMQERFRWHLSVVVACKDVALNGMPTGAEIQLISRLEHQLATHLRLRDNAIFIARITCGGRRELTYQLSNPKSADDALIRLRALPNPVREWKHHISFDPTWSRTRAVFTLLEGAQR